jgi:hypothetical protein
MVVALLAAAWWTTGALCPFALATGTPCPGCGLGRATIALVTGHPAEAFHFHPLVFVVLPALFVFLTFPPAHHRRSPPRGQAPVTPSAASQGLGAGKLRLLFSVAILVAVFGVWIARFAGAFGGPVPVRSAWTVTR